MTTPNTFINMTDEQVEKAAELLAVEDGHKSKSNYNLYYKEQYEKEIRRFATIASCIMQVVENE